jgi:hypothetical protein
MDNEIQKMIQHLEQPASVWRMVRKLERIDSGRRLPADSDAPR